MRRKIDFNKFPPVEMTPLGNGQVPTAEMPKIKYIYMQDEEYKRLKISLDMTWVLNKLIYLLNKRINDV